MLVDERRHRLRAVECQMTNPVHMRLDVHESRPSQFTSSALSQCDMEKLVRPLKRTMVITCSRVSLAGQESRRCEPDFAD